MSLLTINWQTARWQTSTPSWETGEQDTRTCSCQILQAELLAMLGRNLSEQIVKTCFHLAGWQLNSFLIEKDLVRYLDELNTDRILTWTKTGFIIVFIHKKTVASSLNIDVNYAHSFNWLWKHSIPDLKNINIMAMYIAHLIIKLLKLFVTE